MKVIVGKRGSGKTEAAIRLAGEHSAYMVVANPMRRVYVDQRAKEMGVDIPPPVTYEEFLYGQWSGSPIRAFVVDDIDDLVQSIAKTVPVLAITVTYPDAEEEERFRQLAQEVTEGWREDKARRKHVPLDLPAGALAVPADVQDLVARLSETAMQRQEEAFRCLGVPGKVT